MGNGLSRKGNVQLDEDAVAPSRAFEVFMGKVYSTWRRLDEGIWLVMMLMLAI